MKKSIIAAGAASVALAAMPIVGVFATDGGSVSDKINASITTGCVLSESVDKTVSIAVAPGSAVTSGEAISVSAVCNAGSWYITAIGAGEETGHETDLYNKTANKAIATHDAPADQSSSAWGFKIAKLTDADGNNLTTTVAEVASGYGTGFKAVPGTATKVVTIKQPTTIKVNTQYQVFATNAQDGGTYEGKVTYTITDTDPTT